MDWIVTVMLSALLAGAAVWTSDVQRRHDSLSILVSAVAVFPAALSVPAFAVYLTQRDIFSVTSARPPFGLGGFLALISVCVGPFLFLVAGLQHCADRLPASAILLQVTHFLLWAVLTLFALALGVDV